MGKTKQPQPEKKTLVEKTENADRSKLSDEDSAFLTKMEGITSEIAENVEIAWEAIARFNEKFKARKIPKQKIQTMSNSLIRLSEVFGDDHPSVVQLRKELAASELASNEVGNIFEMEKKLKKCRDILVPKE